MSSIKIAISVAIVVLVGAGGYFFYKNSQKPNTAQYSPVYSPSSMTQNSTSPITNDSNQQLDQDMTSINAKLNGVDQAQINIDAGMNQTAPNLGQ